MKRVVLSIAGTVIGLVALLDFKTHGHPIAGALPAAGLPGASSSTSVSAPQSTGTSAPPQPGGASSSAKSTAAAATKTLTGSAVETQYGIVQVQVTVSGSRITNVRFLQLTAYDQRSADINGQAAPILLQETLSAQSSQIDTVSGASYTSDGYVQSLQSALDQVGLK
jgi:uncharacterized protein with FMN-binding domain